MQQTAKKVPKMEQRVNEWVTKAVIDGKMGVNRVADQYGVPRSTLKDGVSARHGARSGPQPYLSYEEEDVCLAPSPLNKSFCSI